jgi:hypothetical protein
MLEAQALRILEIITPYITAATLIALPFAIAEPHELAVYMKFLKKILPQSLTYREWFDNLYRRYIQRLAERSKCYGLSLSSTEHRWEDIGVGHQCKQCRRFIPHGLEPWLPWELVTETFHEEQR